MNKVRKQRILVIVAIGCIVATAIALILYALKQNMNAFLTPKEITAEMIETTYHFRLGGLVKPGSVKRMNDQLSVNFIVTDLHKEIPVTYTGVLPDLFREGKGVIASGYLMKSGQFAANEVLAKHDENYMPQSVYLKLKNSALEPA